MTEVVTALGHRFESEVAAKVESIPGVSISRRCADLAELISVVEAGVGEVAVIGADLRGLDLEVVTRLRARGVRVIGLFSADDENSERRLRQLSFATVLPFDVPGSELGAAIINSRSSGDDREADDLLATLDADDANPSPTVGRSLGPAAVALDPTDGRDGGSGHREPSSPHPGSEPVKRGWTPAGAGGSDDSDHDESGEQADSVGPSPATGTPDSQGPEGAVVVAVWGPAGSPGRTTVATALAAELAGRGTEVLLLDADTYGGCVAQTLGLLDEAPGIAAACRAADQGTLDVLMLSRLAPVVIDGLRVLTGLPKAERWPEVRASAFERVIELSRTLVPIVVVDCGFCLESDEELSYDTAAPRRNEATLTALANADIAIAVSGADPIALQRFVRGLQELGSVPSPPPLVVVNRVRSSAVGSKPRVRIAESLHRFAGLEAVRFVPDDPATVDAAVLVGRSVVEHAPDSALRSAFVDLASAVAPWTTVRRGAGRARWRKPSRGERRNTASG